MKYLKRRSSLSLVFVAIFFIAISSNIAKKSKTKRKFGLFKLGQKKDKIAKAGYERKYGDITNLERRFETIRDLGSIVRCKLRSEETTIVTGNSLLCGGKRYMITPEAAKDAEESATTRQTISFGPNGGPQDIASTLKAGLYGKPIMAFLGESSNPQSQSNLFEPHDKYPSFGIYDKGLRSADPAFFTSSKPASMSLESGRTSYDDDVSDNQIKNFGGMELGDISHAVSDDAMKAESPDAFYRDYKVQNDAFEMNGAKSKTSNPFGQYWKSLKSSFYETTPSQLGEADPVANSRHEIPVKGQIRAMIPRGRDAEPSTKKSNIQQSQNTRSNARKTIPRPEEAPKTVVKNPLGLGHKRYFISGQRYPLGMFAGVPIGPWQFDNRGQMPIMRSLNQFPMMPSARLPTGFNRAAPQTGVTRSFNGADEWGARASPRYFDPMLTGSPVRVPMNPLYAQMRANEFTGEPGLPTRGKFQYGIQPGNGPPFLGFASVPIMQQVPMNNERANHPGFPGMGGEMEGGFQGAQEDGGFSRGGVPFNYGQNEGATSENGNDIPGLVQGTAQEIPNSRQPVGLPVNGEMENHKQLMGLNQEESFESETMDESASNSIRSMNPQEDASDDFERITGPERYVPAPFYRPPTYNPHESEDFFPDGTNGKMRQQEHEYLQKSGFTGPQSEPYKEDVKGPEGNAAEIYEDERQQEEQQQEEEEERKRNNLRKTTRIDINGNKIEEGPDGRFSLTKEHVGFGPITVEAKTAKSAMKDPSDDDD